MKQEQRCSSFDVSRPDDIYHPDFLEGKLGYFDVTVCNSLQPSHIIKATTKAGSAPEVAEYNKDIQHESEVTAAGGVSIPTGCGDSWFVD